MWVLLGLSVGATAHAQEATDTWAIGEFAGNGVDAQTASTFRVLLRDELQAQNHATFVDVQATCDTDACAAGAARGTGASVVVYGRLDRLGSKLIASARGTDVRSGAPKFSQKMVVDRVEDLTIAAKRIAEAIADGGTTDDNARLGTVTEEEAKPPVHRGVRAGAFLSSHGIVPTKGYAQEQLGTGVALGAFIEMPHYYIAPSFGLRFDLTRRPEGYVHLPIELVLAYIIGNGDVAPILGVGAGLNLLFESVPVHHSVGKVLVSTNDDVVNDFAVGATIFPRVGILFLRTYVFSVELYGEYALTAADFQLYSHEAAFRFGMNLIAGDL
jgi:hypothetical protein